MEIVLTAFVLLLFEILCGISFLGGFYLGKKKRPTEGRKEPTKEEIAEIEKARREFENFMSYTGQPQNDINGIDR